MKDPTAKDPTAILIVEDDGNLRVGLRDVLTEHRLEVFAAASALEADALRRKAAFALVILDVMLPGEDGYAYCRRLRAEGSTARVLMLTARTLEDDVVRGFEAGADDYLLKPYRTRELLARVHALLRRSGSNLELHAFGDFLLDPRSRTLTHAGAPVDLTRTEFDLLAYFLRNPDRALQRNELLDAVWGTEVVVDPRTVDNFVSSLKKKLQWTLKSSFVLHTLRGVGYRMELKSMTQP